MYKINVFCSFLFFEFNIIVSVVNFVKMCQPEFAFDDFEDIKDMSQEQLDKFNTVNFQKIKIQKMLIKKKKINE